MTRGTELHRPGWIQHRPRYRADIEGLRAVAVLIVVAFHAGMPGFSGGFVGVDVFFVLSGYLITWLLVNEAEQTGSINLRRFYGRRARRLLPALALVLLVTMAVSAVLYAPLEQVGLSKTWAATAAYVSNLYFAAVSLDYHAPSAELNPLLHTWSLSVEEQFYLVWPWLILVGLGVFGRRRGPARPDPQRLVAVLAIVTGLSFVGSVVLTKSHGMWAFYLSPTRAWEFGAGGLAALIPLRPWPRRLLNPRLATRVTVAFSWLALLGLAIATVTFDYLTPFPGMAALLPVAATVVLLRTGAPLGRHEQTSANSLLARPLLQAIGKLSYSWYLWHWPALVFAAAIIDPLPPSGRAAAILISLALAQASYSLVEDPLRRSSYLEGRSRRSLAMALGISFFGVGMAGAWWHVSLEWNRSGEQAEIHSASRARPQIYRDGCDAFGTGRAEVLECVYGDGTSDRTIVLVGDSHAGQYFPPWRAAVDSAGWRLVVITLSSCPFVDLPPLHNRTLGRRYDECVGWRRSAEQALAQLKPDWIFVSSASAYHSLTTMHEWEAGTRTSLERLKQLSRGVSLIADPPYAGFDVPACLARKAWRPGQVIDPDCRPRGNQVASEFASAQVRVARSILGVSVLDLRDRVCTIGACDARTDKGVIRYRDGSHLTVEFSLTLLDDFRAVLLDVHDRIVQEGPVVNPAGDQVPPAISRLISLSPGLVHGAGSSILSGANSAVERWISRSDHASDLFLSTSMNGGFVPRTTARGFEAAYREVVG